MFTCHSLNGQYRRWTWEAEPFTTSLWLVRLCKHTYCYKATLYITFLLKLFQIYQKLVEVLVYQNTSWYIYILSRAFSRFSAREAEWVRKRLRANIENTRTLIPVSHWWSLITSLYRGDRSKWSTSKRESSVCPDLLRDKRELTFYCLC